MNAEALAVILIFFMIAQGFLALMCG